MFFILFLSFFSFVRGAGQDTEDGRKMSAPFTALRKLVMESLQKAGQFSFGGALILVFRNCSSRKKEEKQKQAEFQSLPVTKRRKNVNSCMSEVNNMRLNTNRITSAAAAGD